MLRSLVLFVFGLVLSACSLYGGEGDGGEAAPPARLRYAMESFAGFDSGPAAMSAASPFHTEAYARIDESEFRSTAQHPLSTFAVGHRDFMLRSWQGPTTPICRARTK